MELQAPKAEDDPQSDDTTLTRLGPVTLMLLHSLTLWFCCVMDPCDPQSGHWVAAEIHQTDTEPARGADTPSTLITSCGSGAGLEPVLGVSDRQRTGSRVAPTPLKSSLLQEPGGPDSMSCIKTRVFGPVHRRTNMFSL